VNPPGYPPPKNVTGPGAPRAVMPPTGRARQNQIVVLVLVVLVVVGVVKACSGGENRYERIAHELTQAVQNNDLAAVQKLENAQTAVEMTRARLGRASDQLAPLGKIKRVKEVTPPNGPPRVHEFDVTFDKGGAHESITVDPQDKIVHFHEQPTTQTK
jgi:hypothetical protein